MLKARPGDQSIQAKGENLATFELQISPHFRCPISLELMKDPVTLSTGITYDRQSINKWLDDGNQTCPVTNQQLNSLQLLPNHAIRKMIQDWCIANRSFSTESIPTPHVPITPEEVSAVLTGISRSSLSGDSLACHQWVLRINALARKRDQNRNVVLSKPTAYRVLSTAFKAFAEVSGSDCSELLMEEILSVLSWMFPLDEEARILMSSPSSLRCLVWFVNCGSLAGRRNAVLIIKDLALSSDQLLIHSLSNMDGLTQSLVKVLQQPICRVTTRASLVSIFHLISASPTAAESAAALKFVELGLIELLLEMLVDADRSICERALGVLDGLCGCDVGRERASRHGLTVPVLVKKICRVPDLATDFAVSALWKVGKNARGEDRDVVLVEALKMGAFQKVLLLLQVGCSEETKERASDLLKLLNVHRMRGECIDSMDFRQLKRTFQ